MIMIKLSIKPNVYLLLLACLILSIYGCGQPKIQIKNPKIQIKTMEIADEISPPQVEHEYIIGPGDKLEVLYQTAPKFSSSVYMIDIEDTLQIGFYYYPNLNKTVQVRPDGIITLHRIGEVKAVEVSPGELSKKISARYRPYLTKPVVTVEVVNYNAKVEELKKAINTAGRGQSRLTFVRPDGKISLPFIKDILAAGLTCSQLSRNIEKKYLSSVADINIAVALLEATSNQAYIMGAVKNPNFYRLIGPTSLTQLIAMAGGFTNVANTHQVILISRGKKNQPVAQVIDMDDAIGKGDISSDPFIARYDVIFIPQTRIAQAALVVEALRRMIPYSFNVNYNLVDLWKSNDN